MQRIAVFLLNSMASRVDKCQKLFLGDIGTISVSTCVATASTPLFCRVINDRTWSATERETEAVLGGSGFCPSNQTID